MNDQGLYVGEFFFPGYASYAPVTAANASGINDGAAAVVEADLTRATASLRRTLRLGQPARSDVQT